MQIHLVFDTWQRSYDYCAVLGVLGDDWEGAIAPARYLWGVTQAGVLDITFRHIPLIPSSDIEPRAPLSLLWGIYFWNLEIKIFPSVLCQKKYLLHAQTQAM